MARIAFVVTVLTLVLVVETPLGATTRASISLNNNGYEGIEIAIGESVPVSKSTEMIRRIKVRALFIIRRQDKPDCFECFSFTLNVKHEARTFMFFIKEYMTHLQQVLIFL